MLINFLVWMLKCAVTLLFCTCFAHKNMKNTPSKVEYFSKIAEIFSNAKNGQAPSDLQPHYSNGVFGNVYLLALHNTKR